LKFLIFQYRNAVADNLNPDYRVIGSVLEDGVLKETVADLVWVVWLLSALLFQIVLFNFVIAVISKSFEESGQKSSILFYIEKARINRDYFEMLSNSKKCDSFEILVL
jgi:hypothetical protein